MLHRITIIKRIVMITGLLLLADAPASAQTQIVMFDGITLDQGEAAALLVPAAFTDNDYTVLGRLEYGLHDRVGVFIQAGGVFNNGATGFAGVGWVATLYRESDSFPLNIGFFNSIVVPLESGGPDALVTVAPVFSHSFEFGRRQQQRITPYIGATANLLVNSPAPGNRTDVNALLGLKVHSIAEQVDITLEGQLGDKSLFAFGFHYRF